MAWTSASTYYFIAYDLDGGYWPEGVKSPTAFRPIEDDITIPQPKRDGYVFMGWTSWDIEEPVRDVVLPSGTKGGRLFIAHWQKLLDPETDEFSGITVNTAEDGKHTVTFDGSGEETVNIPLPLEASQVVYNRYFLVGQPAAVFLPFDVDENVEVTGGKFYRFDKVEYEDSKWVVTMRQTTQLEANMPYMLMPESDHLTFDLCGKPVIMQTVAKTPNSKNGWSFLGTYEKLVWTSESSDYGFSALNPNDNIQREFTRFADGDYVLPLRCYLSYTGPYVPFSTRRYAEAINLPETVEIRLLDENGNPYGGVGIYTIKNEKRKEKSEDVAYDLSGRKVNFQFSILNSQLKRKGIYIVNGKKMFADGF